MTNIINPSHFLINKVPDLNWSESVSKNMTWLSKGILDFEKEESEDIVERFTSMSNITRNISVSF